jgi:hypothetical protein
VAQSYEVNVGDWVRDQGKAHLQTVALATVDPTWNEENIDQLWKSEWIEQAYERIATISRLQVKLPDSFRSFVIFACLQVSMFNLSIPQKYILVHH